MRLFILLPLIFLAGCNYIDRYSLMFRKDWEEEKTKITEKYKAETAVAIKELEDKQKIKEAKELANLQKASGLAFGIHQISEIKPVEQRSRPDLLVNLKSRDLVTILPALSPEDILKVNAELKQELDEKLTSIKDLQKKYDESIDEIVKSKNEIVSLSIDRKSVV